MRYPRLLFPTVFPAIVELHGTRRVERQLRLSESTPVF